MARGEVDRSATDEGQRHPRGERVTQTHTEAPSARAASAGRGGRLGRFIREVISEMRKVLWPSRNELVTYTIVVIIFVVVMVSIVAGLDVGFAKLVLQVFG
jgi:preprotein translocase subunit SecE